MRRELSDRPAGASCNYRWRGLCLPSNAQLRFLSSSLYRRVVRDSPVSYYNFGIQYCEIEAPTVCSRVLPAWGRIRF